MGSMEKNKGLIMMMAVALLAYMVVMGGTVVKMVSAVGLSPSQCMEERRLGVNACKPIAFGQPPSAACCQRFRVSHIECICPAISPRLAALVDVNRATSLLKTCGRRVPRHFKCGSLRFP